MTRLEAGEPMTRRRMLLLGVGGLTAAILAACGSSGSTASIGGAPSQGNQPGPGGSGLRIRMTGDDALGGAFDPVHLTARVGDTVVWENTGATSHTAICDPENPFDVPHVLPEGAEPFHSGTVLPGDTFEHTLEVAGDYTYTCMLHPDAVGHLTVTG